MPLDPREELKRRVDEFPDEALSYFNSNFTAIASLADEARNAALKMLLDALKRGQHRVDGSALRSISELSQRDAEKVASTYLLVVGLLTDSAATPEDFALVARGKLFREENERAALSLAQSICSQRDEISRAVQRAQLGGAVLPSLRKFEIATDVRLKISDGAVKNGVPVIVAHIDTDADRQELWVQLSQRDVEEIIRKMNECLKDMAIAESVIPPLK